jgi:uncharacterized protein YcnI
MHRRSILTSLAATFAALIIALVVAAPVSAHIDPDPNVAPPGSRQSLAFTVQHGCDGSPTVQVDIRMAGGVTDVAPEPVAGWTGAVESDDEGDTVVFVGGPLPDDQPQTFAVDMVLPDTPGATIFFPTVQRCEEGEIRWIGLPDAGGNEADEPAPALRLTSSVQPEAPVGTEAVPPASVAPSTVPPASVPDATDAGGTGEPVASPVASSVDGTVDTVAASESTVSTGDSDDGDATPWLIAGIVAVVVAVGVVLVVRSNRSG